MTTERGVSISMVSDTSLSMVCKYADLVKEKKGIREFQLSGKMKKEARHRPTWAGRK